MIYIQFTRYSVLSEWTAGLRPELVMAELAMAELAMGSVHESVSRLGSA